MAARRYRSIRDEGAFTIVELLVVVIVIGLLVAIAIPSFFAQRGKAHDAGAKQTARVAALAMETWSTERDGSYGGATVPALVSLEPTLTGASLSVVSASGEGFQLSVASPTGNQFDIERSPAGTWNLTCVQAGTAGCPASGSWD